MKAKIFLSSILTIALCLSLIVGSTFALFDVEKTVNIAVTAGKLDIEANIPQSDVNASGMLCYDENNPTENAKVENNVLVINKFVPGDVVVFDIEVANKSNIPIKYMVTTAVSDTNNELMEAIVCTATVNNGAANAETLTVNSIDSTDESAYFTAPAASGTNGTSLTTVRVTVKFSTGLAEDKYDALQGKSAAIAFLVKAVQGDGDTTNP